jgi:undecaprenyl diphosphate synthase
MIFMQTDTKHGLHVAIIMDGNGRWATQRGLPRVAGHRAGVAAVRRVVESAPDLGISRLTLYAFSSDNWRRPAGEVESIFRLLRTFLRLETERLRQHGTRLQVIGRRDRLPKLVLHEIERSERATQSGRRLHLCVAIDYSSRDAIMRAVAGATTALGKEEPTSAELLGPLLVQALTTQNGDVDLLIRSGGEKRLSDFLLWESAYAELLFTDRMWPDFNEADLETALKEFGRRERRFGTVPARVLPLPLNGIPAFTHPDGVRATAPESGRRLHAAGRPRA